MDDKAKITFSLTGDGGTSGGGRKMIGQEEVLETKVAREGMLIERELEGRWREGVRWWSERGI